MRIVFDLLHPAHVNFFKNVIRRLDDEGHEVTIIGLRRGALPSIIEREFGGFKRVLIGRHRGSRVSIIVEANMVRFWQLLAYLGGKRMDVGVTVGGFLLGAALTLLGKPNIQFDDDPESRKNFRLEKLTSTELFLPIFGEGWPGVQVLRALKEWAYLSPRYFQPQVSALEPYGVTHKKFIFIREVSTGSLNYYRQVPNVIAAIASQVALPRDVKVLLSLEDKRTSGQYPGDWIQLREPVDDIHSLMYHSKIVISSGDSMAREGAMLGVPSLYCGDRDMAANRVLMSKGMLAQVTPEDVPMRVRDRLEEEDRGEEQTRYRNALHDEWEDVTDRIVREIYKYDRT